MSPWWCCCGCCCRHGCQPRLAVRRSAGYLGHHGGRGCCSWASAGSHAGRHSRHGHAAACIPCPLIRCPLGRQRLLGGGLGTDLLGLCHLRAATSCEGQVGGSPWVHGCERRVGVRGVDGSVALACASRRCARCGCCACVHLSVHLLVENLPARWCRYDPASVLTCWHCVEVPPGFVAGSASPLPTTRSATPSRSSSRSRPPSRTPSSSGSPTRSSSKSKTGTPSLSTTRSPTRSVTGTPTGSPSSSASITLTRTASGSRTLTRTASASRTPSRAQS